jgi:hypothetical protein
MVMMVMATSDSRRVNPATSEKVPLLFLVVLVFIPRIIENARAKLRDG